MNILPISNIINVTVSDTPTGLSVPNVNSLALFTTESPSNINIFGTYLSPSQVANDYGSGSVTAAMANAVFAQTPNILSGGGQLVIIPLQGSVSATSGSMTTPNISANLASLLAVTNGDLKVVINGVNNNLLNLNLTNCATLADIATLLQNVLPDVTVTAVGTEISMVSTKVGTASTVTIGSVSGGTGTDLSQAGYLNAGGSSTLGGSAATGETLVQAINRTESAVQYAGVITNLYMDDSVIETTANAVQAQDLIFVQHGASTQDIAGLATAITAASNTKTRIVVYTLGQALANLAKAAYAGRGFSTDYTGSNTASTMNLKSLATITPDPNITQTLYNAAAIAGCDVYVSIAGVPCVISNGANSYFDEPYNDLALKFALETAGFNFLQNTQTKVPQTEQGMNGLKGAYEQICEQFVTNGCLAPGQWNSSDTFGNPQIFLNNVLNRGYYVYSLPIVQQTAAARAGRTAPVVQIAGKRAGAIHSGDVLVLVNA